MATLSVTPNPCCVGQKAKICATGNLPVTIDVKFTPPGTTQTYTLTKAKPCVEVDVPDNAITLVVHDQSGGSTDLATTCVVCAASPTKPKPKKPKK